MLTSEGVLLMNAALRSTGPKAPRTFELYSDCLNRLFRLEIDIHDPEITTEWLGHYKKTTRNTYLSAIIAYMRGTEGDDHELTKRYRKLLRAGIGEVQAQYERSAYTEAQEAQTANVTWEDIRAYREQLGRQVKSFTPDSFDRKVLYQHLLLSLYTKQPPKRNDWADVIVLEKPLSRYPPDANYYIPSEGTLILAKYKTARTYGQKRIRVPEEIQVDIAKTVELLKPANYLFFHDLTGDKWSRNYLSQFFREIMPGVKLGSCLLRKMVKTEWSRQGLGASDRLAAAMDHAASTASHYYDQNQRASIENNPLGIAM